ncbi:electron transport complex subunit RsxC [bacterium]|nr:electron transport complex subunit RsxC [bacterium]
MSTATRPFRGGIHPDDRKLTADMPIQQLPLPAKVRIPLAQHLGAPAAAVVKKGDKVTVGQVVGECHGFVSAAVHATVSGTVTAVGTCPHPSGGEVPAVWIEADGADTWRPDLKPVGEINGPAIVQAVKAAGIVGMGGATFPTQVKLSPPEGKKISVLIVNAAECEPFLTCDYRMMIEHGGKIVRGAELLMAALGVGTCVIGIERNKPKAIEHMQSLVKGRSAMSVQALRTRYPQGGEKQLICALTGREVPSGGLPMDVGCLVQNVATAAAVADAVDLGRPLVERVMTVSGDALSKPGNYLVRIGMTIGEVLAAAGLDETRMAKVILGGPMMGIAVANLDIPVTKGTSGILALSNEWVKEPDIKPCIRCGRCLDVCPIGLNPTLLERLSVTKDVTALQLFHAVDCIECGCCTYTCPARRPLVHGIRYGKLQIAALRKIKKN